VIGSWAARPRAESHARYFNLAVQRPVSPNVYPGVVVYDRPSGRDRRDKARKAGLRRPPKFSPPVPRCPFMARGTGPRNSPARRQGDREQSCSSKLGQQGLELGRRPARQLAAWPSLPRAPADFLTGAHLRALCHLPADSLNAFKVHHRHAAFAGASPRSIIILLDHHTAPRCCGLPAGPSGRRGPRVRWPPPSIIYLAGQARATLSNAPNRGHPGVLVFRPPGTDYAPSCSPPAYPGVAAAANEDRHAAMAVALLLTGPRGPRSVATAATLIRPPDPGLAD